jgi:phosphoribosylformylglycinamidine synthase PurS subunit
MKARVFVSFKSTVLDPQGQTICGALNGLGHKSIAGVRQGKVFELEVAPEAVKEAAGKEQVRQEIEQIARDVLANPVIEDYRVEIVD